MIEKNQIITLDNNSKYFVANTIIYNNEKYALIINVEIDNKFYFIKQKKINKITIINDAKLIENISKILKEDLINY